MLQAARRSIQFNRDGDAGGNPRREAKKETEAETVADSEDDRVGYRASKQPQRAVLPAQQIVCKVQAAEHIQAGTDDADHRNGVVVHSVSIVDAVASTANENRSRGSVTRIGRRKYWLRRIPKRWRPQLQKLFQSFDILRAMPKRPTEFSAPTRLDG